VDHALDEVKSVQGRVLSLLHVRECVCRVWRGGDLTLIWDCSPAILTWILTLEPHCGSLRKGVARFTRCLHHCALLC
jgi:hypothetical protein